MALQLTVTGDAGLDISYWKINGASNSFDGPKMDFRFDMQGYKDAEWRAKGSSAKSLTFHVLTEIEGSAAVLYTEEDARAAVDAVAEVLYVEGDTIPEGKAVGDVKTEAVAAVEGISAGDVKTAAGPAGTSPADRSATILNNTSGDLRPALYTWLKTHDATATSGPADDYGNSDQTVDWSSAVDA